MYFAIHIKSVDSYFPSYFFLMLQFENLFEKKNSQVSDGGTLTLVKLSHCIMIFKFGVSRMWWYFGFCVPESDLDIP